MELDNEQSQLERMTKGTSTKKDATRNDQPCERTHMVKDNEVKEEQDDSDDVQKTKKRKKGNCENPESSHNKKQREEDVISKLLDDVLLTVLEKVNLTTAVRAGVLCTRWKHLPWSLTRLSIDVNDFLPESCTYSSVDNHIDKAMSSLTGAVRSMLDPIRRKSVITRLCISVPLTNSYSSKIGQCVNEATENGIVKDIELRCGVERVPGDVSDEQMVENGDAVTSFFGNYPSISCCLSSLSLYNATFRESDLHNLIANVCPQLHYLYLNQCDTGFNTLFRIDAANSKLSELEFAYCSFEQVELFCLPKLEQLICGSWISRCSPFILGHVPCLKDVEIYCAMALYHKQVKLSELLCGTTCVNTLSLDFRGQQIWLEPEKHQLRSAFSNLKKLCLYDIFVGFGLLWTTALLENAPSLEMLEVEVYDHLCDDEEERNQLYAERTNAWEVSEISQSVHLPLKELELIGFNATEQHIVFIGAIMERASNLETVVLKEKYCEDCSTISTATSGQCRFPKNEDEQDVVVNNIRNRFSSNAQVIFRDHDSE
ncbi:hypothetical protein ACP4OV_022532 [Aristida adscensionis]